MGCVYHGRLSKVVACQAGANEEGKELTGDRDIRRFTVVYLRHVVDSHNCAELIIGEPSADTVDLLQ